MANMFNSDIVLFTSSFYASSCLAKFILLKHEDWFPSVFAILTIANVELLSTVGEMSFYQDRQYSRYKQYFPYASGLLLATGFLFHRLHTSN
jgi:hypothetical protein